MSATGRFAPSPTGSLHLGNLRTALVAWFFARSTTPASRFLIRMEDLDLGRARERYYDEQLADLAALGLDWDGNVVRQSLRTELYEDALATLQAAGLLYECWCTRAEIRAACSAPHADDALEQPYPGTCRRLTAAQRAERRAEGRPPAVRVAADGARVAFDDLLAGRHEGRVDDFVVRRNDGAFAYNLAVVVDDAEQGVEEVVRGADLLSSTPRQLWLGERLGLAAPVHVHVPLLLGADGQRLAKRHGAVTLAERNALGETAAQVRVSLAASLGLCAPHDTLTADELAARFAPGLLRTPAVA